MQESGEQLLRFANLTFKKKLNKPHLIFVVFFKMTNCDLECIFLLFHLVWTGRDKSVNLYSNPQLYKVGHFS